MYIKIPNYLAMLAELRSICEGLFRFLYHMRRIFPDCNLTRISHCTASSQSCVFPICGTWRGMKTGWENQLNEQNLNSLIGEFHGNHRGKNSSMWQ